MTASATCPPQAQRTLADLPTPPGLPLLGQALALKPLQLARQLEDWGRDIGTPYRLKIGPRTLVVFDDAEAMQALLRSRPEGVRRNRNIQPVFAEMGINGVFSVEGEGWHAQRRLVMQALNPSHFRAFHPTLLAITERLHRRWAAAAEEGRTLEMTDELVRYTVDVTSALAFGEDPNTLERGSDTLQRHLAAIFPMVMKRVMAPWPYWRHVRLPADRRLERDLAAVHAHAHQTIARARQRLAQDRPAQPRHALEAMLMMAGRPEGGFDDATIVANVITLLLGGEDTTAHSLAWTMLFLTQDPLLQERLHGQARALVGNAPVCPHHEGIRQLDVFEALAFEALRLKPVVPTFGLGLLQPAVLGDVALPAGSDLLFLSRPAMTSPRHYAEPLRYDPWRWLRPPGEALHDPRAFLQFGAGPRVCPGRHLATVELRLVLSMLLRHFRVELMCRPEDVQEVTAFTMLPSRLPVRLHPRG
jgi:cytochrome P450